MANISAKDIANLRAQTGIGMMDCKKALLEAGGDFDKAKEVLRKKGMAKAEKRAERETKAGVVESYVHSDQRLGVIVEVLAETDFVAKNEEFKEFAHDIALHIAAINPKYIGREDVSEAEVSKAKEQFIEDVKASGKPEDIALKIVEGKLSKYFEEICLLEQPFVKDPSLKIKDLLNEKIAKIGEKIIISRFCRFEIGA